MKPIAEALKAIRTSKKISQESLAYACGLSRNYVGVIEKGENKILNKFSKEDLETLLFE
jgi:transcriptional regulator with XRE-family HTH domain